jgi:Ca2+-transporting ATPase
MYYYDKKIVDIYKKLNTDEHGLSGDEVQRRLDEHGLNELESGRANIPLLIFLHQFRDPLVIILIIAAAVALLIADYIDSLVIFAVVIINAIIGFIQEYKADKAMKALQKMSISYATAVRNGKEIKIDARQLTFGDIVVISTGNKVPADVRLFEVHSLEVDESMLTGESMPVSKIASTLSGENIPVSEQNNMAFMGTIATNGRAKGIVVATGMRTQLGNISRQVGQTKKESTPLQKRLLAFTRGLGVASIVLAGVVILIGVATGRQLIEMVLFGISTIVAVIPEGLPIVVTVTMAVGVQRMAKRNAIIRKLVAVEILGNCNYICSDKTGTLTENRMSVVKAFTNNKEFVVVKLDKMIRRKTEFSVKGMQHTS